MNQSESINELADALAKAQGEIKGAKKDSQNPFFKSSYADLAAVWDAIRDPLSKNGLSVVQTTDLQEGGTALFTTLIHKSGQWVRGVYPIISKDETPQGFGSGMTYARRYALMGIVGVAPVDDDGEAAMARDKPHRETQIRLSKTDQQIQFWKMAKHANWSNDDVLEKMKLLFGGKDKTAALSDQEMSVLWGLVETNPKKKEVHSG